ncbi:MAG: hypothetical protein FWD92_06155 [Methanomassiliicoccaceae archaeon]|nr:hypothetical protein [Methanomassiliicoccaceae archaeon]
MKEWSLLCDHIASMKKAVVSFSGGIDSTVVLAAAVETLPDHIAVFADIPMLSKRQRAITNNVAKRLGADMVTVKLEWDDMEGVRDNTPEKCYFCKRAIYSEVKRIASENGYVHCLDGENISDKSEDRPGRKAASEFGIISPLMTLGFERDAVRKMFDHLQLNIDVQKETCMATRIPEGVPFNDADILMIDECEEIIRNISHVKQIRMRLRDNCANLLTSPDSIHKLIAKENELSSALSVKGIHRITIDEKGYEG